jgi:hypothetical protein
VGPSTAPTSDCAAQVCGSVGDCDAVLGTGKWVWDGKACQSFYASGCGLDGPDCAALFDSEQACNLRFSDRCAAGER